MKIDELQNRPHGLCITTVKLLLIILREVDADDPDVECDQVKIFTLLSIIKVFFNIRVQFILHEKRSVYLLSNIFIVKVEDDFWVFLKKKTDCATTSFYQKSFSLTISRLT